MLKVRSAKKKSTQACVFFLQGRCKNGRSCRFSHNTGPDIVQPTCKYWASSRGKSCIHGNSCRFAHTAASETADAARASSPKSASSGYGNERTSKRKLYRTTVLTVPHPVPVARPPTQTVIGGFPAQKRRAGLSDFPELSKLLRPAPPPPGNPHNPHEYVQHDQLFSIPREPAPMVSLHGQPKTAEKRRNPPLDARFNQHKPTPGVANLVNTFPPPQLQETTAAQLQRRPVPQPQLRAPQQVKQMPIVPTLPENPFHHNLHSLRAHETYIPAPSVGPPMHSTGSSAMHIDPEPAAAMQMVPLGSPGGMAGSPVNKPSHSISMSRFGESPKRHEKIQINSSAEILGAPPPGFAPIGGPPSHGSMMQQLSAPPSRRKPDFGGPPGMSPVPTQEAVVPSTIGYEPPRPRYYEADKEWLVDDSPMNGRNGMMSNGYEPRFERAHPGDQNSMSHMDNPMNPYSQYRRPPFPFGRPSKRQNPSGFELDIMDHHDFSLRHEFKRIPPLIPRCPPTRIRPSTGRIRRNPRTQQPIETNLFPMEVSIKNVWVFQIMHSPYSTSDFSKQNILKKTNIWRELQDRINPSIVLAHPYIFTHVEPAFLRMGMMQQGPHGCNIHLNANGSPFLVTYVNCVQFDELDYENQRLLIDRTLEDLLKNQGYNNLGGTWIQKNPREQLKKPVSNGKETFYAYRTYSKSVAKGDKGWYVLLELNFKILEKLSIEEKLKYIRRKAHSEEDFYQQAYSLQGSKTIIGYTFQKHTLNINWHAGENSMIMLDNSQQLSVKDYVEKKYNLPVQKRQHVSQEENGKLFLCQYLYRTGNSRQHKQIYTKLLEQQNTQEDKELIYRFANSLRRICDATQSSLRILAPETAMPLYLSSIYLRFQSHKKVEICDSREFQKQWNSKVSGVLQHNKNTLLTNWCVIVEGTREGSEAVQHLSRILNSVRRKRRWKQEQLTDPHVEHISFHGNLLSELRALQLHEQKYSIILFVLCGGEEHQKQLKALLSRFCAGSIYKDFWMATQFVKAENLRTGRAINVGFEVIEQMLFKTGKVLYTIRLEEDLALVDNVMWIAVDTCHENGLLYFVVCACCDPLSTRREDYKFYASMSHQNCASSELIPSAMTHEITKQAIDWYEGRVGTRPRAIVVLRDDVSVPYEVHYQKEIGVLRSFGIPMLYLVVVKNHSFRIFTTPISGIVVDKEPTSFDSFSFYVQHTKDSRLTKYTVVIDELGVTQTQEQIRALYQLLYAMSHAYPPHKVGIKLPAICQWADHFATWLSEMISEELGGLSDMQFTDPHRPIMLDLRNILRSEHESPRFRMSSAASDGKPASISSIMQEN